ncbi:PAS domain S-box protein [Fodinibius sp.]|uniref:PAS domain S-box protein n=1 Tax=Fodinibius sp. TaxID=1872440 RepID=UPI002ACE1DFE|nr:PAS domain S-box protein [Fodinibius sp.]MDZ7660363.1 PAS domain S-box protein [Fodinibius sp.]
MDRTYQILLLADDKSDVKLINRTLSGVGLEHEITIMQTRKELESLLAENTPHLVISNYNLANFSATDALTYAKAHAPNLPFIIIGEHIGEEKVVDILHQGASDYINKSNISRLKSVVDRELLKADHPENTESQNTFVYKHLLERTKEQACIFHISSLDEQQLTIKELLENTLRIIPQGWAYPEITEASITFKEKTYSTEHFRETPWLLRSTKSDLLLSGTLTVSVVYTEEKPPRDLGPFLHEEQQLLDLITGLLGLKIDHIQSRKDLQEKDQIIAKAYDLASIGHWELDLTNQSLHWSKEIKRLHEVDEDYEPDLDSAINFYKEGYHRKKIQEAVQRAIDEAIPFDEELKIITAKDNERWIHAVGEAEFENGQCRCIYGSTQDITSRKRAEKKLKSTEQKLRDIVENSTNMFYRHDTDHVLTYLSPQCKDFLGYPVEEAKKQWTEFTTDHPINEEGLEHTQKAIETGQPQPAFELQLQKRNGEIIWVLVNEAPIVEDGATVAIVGSLTDITEQKRYEDKLEQLSLVASKTTDLIVLTDADENITWVNDAFEEVTGYMLDEIVGKNPGQLLQGPETDPATVQHIANKLAKPETVQEVILNYTKDGRKYWLDMTIDPILDDDGQCTGFIAIEKDVTAEIERSQKLQESVERYEIVSKATSDTIWDLDLRTDAMQYNQNIYNMFGYEKEEVNKLSQWWRNKIHPADQQYVQDKLDEALSSDEDRIQFEYRFKCADGSYKYIYDRAFVVRNKDNDPIRIIGAMQDITTFKKREQQSREFQEVVSRLATDQSLLQKDLLDALVDVLQISAQTLGVERVNLWLLEDQKLRCVCSFDDGQLNTMRGTIITKQDSPKYFSYIKEHRTVAAEHPYNHEAFSELADSYLTPNNIKSLLDTSVISYGSKQAVVCHESVTRKRSWESDEISFAGAVTDQIAQLLAHQEKKKRDQEIRESLKEKETLLAEVHHRVKNNLAVVSGMMQLQAFEATDKDLRNKLFDSVARIQTMAAIHELLYKSNSFSNLQLDENIKKLISNITDTFQSADNINISYTLDAVNLNVNQAIPCSLIINEVVTNALKHAFEDTGTIGIELFEKHSLIHLTISDNGKGLPDDHEKLIQSGSLGFKLVDTLSKQLEATYQFTSNGNGTDFSLSFDRAKIKGIGSAHLE